jgi:hypothetical protein
LLLTHVLPGEDEQLRSLAEAGFGRRVGLASEGLTYDLG